MKYNWPKKKLCRREKKNLFWPQKYDLSKNPKMPWQHWANISRLSEYGLLLRNKQAIRRSYLLTEKQFSRLINQIAKNFSKNKNIWHDQAIVQFLETRMDVVILRSGFAKTIMQARQMANHWHWFLNGHKHNIPSYNMQEGDVLTLKDRYKNSSLYSSGLSNTVPSHIESDQNKYSIKLLRMPDYDKDSELANDILKVVEYYARW